MKHILIHTILGILILSVGCKKAEDRNCLKSNGNTSSLKLNFENEVDSLFLFDNLEYIIIPDSINYIELIGGKNLLNHIDAQYSNAGISIRNENKCNFLRSYKQKIKAEIHIKSIRAILYEGGETLTNLDTLKSPELRLTIRDGAGPVDLTVENGYMSAVVTHGWGDFTLHGKTSNTFLNCSTNSFCNALDLKTANSLVVNSQTEGDMKVNVNGTQLKAILNRNGNILYKGVPNTVQLIDSVGNGQLIDLNE
ncbi:MAG: DUF2807 domain-containing protein [Brumimicrobium sp.]